MIKPVKFLRTVAITAAVSCACLVSAAAASVSVGTVQADALRLRASADTSAAILATAAKGDAVVVLEDAGNNWYKVDYGSVQGYMSGEYLTISEKADASIGYGKVTTGGSSLNVRTAPSAAASKVTALSDGTVVKITGVDSGWYKIDHNGTTGYVSSDYMTTTKETTSRGAETTAASTSSMGSQIVAYAKQFLGTPYVYGGNGPRSFDCSGFTKYVYAHFGVTLNRTATDQLANGAAVSKSQLQPGDLVFFRANTTKPVSHVGIYIGGGQFIHASTNTYSVKIDNLSTGYYNGVYVYGRHIM
ncbi:SH3 domain-containing C40 family peptidase [Pseudoflavonifractor sp. MSJ-37]|uniref:C40 family peptidase n=1 Tax=Pseudoflavonifractor sp. MSJ-37 TaxID=2841531 RepID=UPI001C11E73E|nr:SH3 domain-containing C40 family peptidase [Pseudoflavonifractor sp. MSJ-37]MBU5434085.1 C40 family peptidase [Pseudoflavonifractor sp. MSJ-37]